MCIAYCAWMDLEMKKDEIYKFETIERAFDIKIWFKRGIKILYDVILIFCSSWNTLYRIIVFNRVLRFFIPLFFFFLEEIVIIEAWITPWSNIRV